MSLPIPNNREQIYLSKIINKDLENIPIPLSRLEIYFKCLLDGDVSKLPVPMSRKELILRNYILDVECDVIPVNRTEVFLKALKSVEVEGLPTPQSKLEVFLDYIIRNGCLEKYEYYPFVIRDYLNVKNTPKAKMRFKGMKGNTLVNLASATSTTINDISPQSNNVPFRCIQNLIVGKTYTIMANLKGYTGKHPLKFRQQTLVDTWVYNSNTIIKDFSDGIKIFTFTPSQEYKELFFYFDTTTQEGTSVTISNILLLEGDYTQIPPSYFKGMKSFGESENKIEVLSDNNLQGELNQSSKATLMYRNSSNELVPIPILRGEWDGDRFLWGDEILEHEDGKLYYHKRLSERLYISGDETNNNVITDKINTIYLLENEEVYPCELSGQLYSFDGETNIFINGGAVVGETVIEVGTKLGPIVDSIRQEARRTTNALEGLVAHGVQECAYQLYPEDFEKAPRIIEGERNA